MSYLNLAIPYSASVVNVMALIGGQGAVPAGFFFEPVVAGYETINFPVYSFLIEHPAPSALDRIMFDLGVRANVSNFSPVVLEELKTGNVSWRSDKDVPTQLQEGGIDLNSISAVVWSHTHFDHIGDTSVFPTTTELVVGPGTQETFFPPYPEKQNSTILAADVQGRKITELSFNSTLNIGGYQAHDYFGDGSFYLLNTPGHITGHISALARVTPTTFIFLGGDSCHHVGQLRPSVNLIQQYPCPNYLAAEAARPGFTVSSAFGDPSTDLNIRTNSILSTAINAHFYANPYQAYQTQTKLAERLDAHPDVFVLLGHDSSVDGIISLFPQKLNAWQALGWKEKATWAFLDEQNPAYRFRAKM